jgi:hypothetical protein
MTLRLTPFLLICLALAAPAKAACFADYKAKQDQPLRLAYGVAELPDSGCSSADAAAATLAPRLAAAGWTLLSILSIFVLAVFVGYYVVCRSPRRCTRH